MWVRFFKLPLASKSLILEAFIALLISGLLVRLIPFGRWAHYFGLVDSETSYQEVSHEREIARKVGWAIAASNGVFGNHFTCLMQGIAGKVMLKRRKVPSTLYLGVWTSPDKSNKLEIKAHAWLRTGSIILVGQQGYQRFHVISKFGDNVQHVD